MELLGNSSTFKTVVAFKLITRLRVLLLNCAPCDWILNFLTVRCRALWIDAGTSSTLSDKTGVPQSSAPLLDPCSCMTSSSNTISEL